MIIKAKAGCAGVLSWEVTGPRGTSSEGRCKNMILDRFLDAWVGNLPAMGFNATLVLGSGTSPVTPGDQTLDIPVQGYRSGSSTEANYAIQQDRTVVPGYTRYRTLARVTYEPSGEDRVYTEAGIHAGSSTAAADALLHQRALFTDAEGNPTTVTVRGDEHFTVTWETYLYLPDAEIITTVDVAGVPTQVTTRPIMRGYGANLNRSALLSPALSIPEGTGRGGNFSLVEVTSSSTNPPGTRVQCPNTQTESISLATGVRRRTFVFPPTSANHDTGFGGFVAASATSRRPLSEIQVKFDPPIMKTQAHTLTLHLDVEVTRDAPDDPTLE